MMNSSASKELPPLAGALGTEKIKKRKSREARSESDKSGKKAHTAEEPVQNAPSARNVLPTFHDAPRAPKNNLAGVPYLEVISELGVKSNKKKSVGPWIQSNLNNESFIHFVVHSRTDEWIHFDKNSISLVIFTEMKNSNYDAGAAEGTANKSEWHAAMALSGAPSMFMDPDVEGTGFFSRAEVIINNVTVPTTHTIGPLFTHYPRIMKIHAQEDPNKKEAHLTNEDQIVAGAAGNHSAAMKKALTPFDHGKWNSRAGRRITVHLDAIFPFCMKSPLHEALENRKADSLCFPPDTRIELKLHFQRTRMECIWMTTEISSKYWTLTEAVQPFGKELRTTITEATLEYDAIELHPARHTELMERFRGGKEMAFYDYDINRGQHSGIIAGASYTENNLQIWPYCRTLVISFYMDHQAFPQPHTNRPMMAFSTFPEGLTRMQIEFANTIHLISQTYENYGIRGEKHQLSKKQLYNYMDERRLVNFTFDELWPDQGEGRSLVQDIVLDVRHLMSDKVQTLKIIMEYGGTAVSPSNSQIAVTSIHPNGRATVKNLSSDRCNWEWEFLQLN